MFQLQKSESVNKTPFCCDGEGGVGLDKEKYCSHSLCIGATNTAASKGMEDCTGIIKTLGRRESVAYSQYVCIPRGRLASISVVLAALTLHLVTWSLLYLIKLLYHWDKLQIYVKILK